MADRRTVDPSAPIGARLPGRDPAHTNTQSPGVGRRTARRGSSEPVDVVDLSPAGAAGASDAGSQGEARLAGEAAPASSALVRLLRRWRQGLLLLLVRSLFESTRPPQPRLPIQDDAGRAGGRRRHRRVGGEAIRVRIDSRVYRVFDVSLGGFSFGPDDGSLIPHQRFYFAMWRGDAAEAQPFRADAVVVRIAEGRVAAQFFLPFGSTRRLIARLVQRSPGRGA